MFLMIYKVVWNDIAQTVGKELTLESNKHNHYKAKFMYYLFIVYI